VSFRTKFLEWLRTYLIVLVSSSVVITLGTFLYANWVHGSFNETLRWTFPISALILLGMGGISLVPLSEYSYIRQGARNPAVARAGMEDLRRGQERAPKFGVVLVLVGITFILVYLLIFTY
jgi:hypothetical protein